MFLILHKGYTQPNFERGLKRTPILKPAALYALGWDLTHFFFFLGRNDAAQSDDDDKSQPALTDTDGGKLKQRT